MAAFTSIVRKSASSLAPLAFCVVRGQRNHSSFIFSAINHGRISHNSRSLAPLIPTFRFYSSESKKPSSDESLLRVIESEIQCAEEADDHERVEEIPSGFPFEIQDDPGVQTITLKRTYQGEDIKVEVYMPDLVSGEKNEDHDEDEHGDQAAQSSIPLLVSVSKEDGPSLEFTVTAYPDEVVIDGLAVKHPGNEDELAYSGPDFHDLDENLQKSFHKYLEIRGIKPSTTNFLHEYMINKDSKEYLVWLKKVKSFIEA